jgi:glutathione S-transferase
MSRHPRATGGLTGEALPDAASTPVLWHFPASHYNEKARWALDWKGIPHRRVALGPSYLLRAWWRTGHAHLPVVILNGRAIGDSTRIIAALERWQPQPPLYPDDPAALTRALALEAFFDEQVAPQVRAHFVHNLFTRSPELAVDFYGLARGAAFRRVLKIIMPVFERLYRRRHDVSAVTAEDGERRRSLALERLEAELQPSGYLVGDRFTVADLTAASILGWGLAAEPPQLQYRLPRPWWQVEAREQVARRPAGQYLAEMYRRHRGVSMEIRP